MKNTSEVEQLKMAELRELKLPRVWREIAEMAGYETFIKIWRICSNPDLTDSNKLYVPSIKKLYDLQRRETIINLLRAGKSCDQVVDELKQHNISVSIDTVRRKAQSIGMY